MTLSRKRPAAPDGRAHDEGSRKRQQGEKPLGIATWNMEGSKWLQSGNSPWGSVKVWMTSNKTLSQDLKASPYKLSIGCFQEAGVPPDSLRARALPHVTTLRDRNEATGELGVAKVSTYHWQFGTEFPRYRPPDAWVYYYDWPGPEGASAGGGRVNQAIVSATPAEELAFIHHELGLRPLIGAKIDGTWYFTLHAPSGGRARSRPAADRDGGGDGWWLVNEVSVRERFKSTPWWVLGDYNLEPNALRDKFREKRVNAVICEPDEMTRRKSGKKFDYAVRNRTAEHLTGEVHEESADRSDHEIVFYPLPE